MADGRSNREENDRQVSSSAVLTLTPESITADTDVHWREALVVESDQIQTAATIWSDAYRHRAAFFHAVSAYLALVSALVATVAGGTALAVTSEAGGVLALVAAALAATSTVVGAASRTGQEQAGAVANTNLADAARVFATTVARYGSTDEALRGFESLISLRDDVVRSAPIEAARTLKKVARELRKLEAGEQGPPMSYAPQSAGR